VIYNGACDACKREVSIHVHIPGSTIIGAPVGPSKRANEIVAQQSHDAARMKRIHQTRAYFDALKQRVRDQFDVRGVER
jgi:hypothetical protein